MVTDFVMISLKKSVTILVVAVSLMCSCTPKNIKIPEKTDRVDNTTVGDTTNSGNETISSETIDIKDLSFSVHDDSKLFLNYADDEKGEYPFDPITHPTESKMHYFNTKSGVGIENTLGSAMKSQSVGIYNDSGVYKTRWIFQTKDSGTSPYLYIDTQNHQMISQIRFEVTNNSSKSLMFSVKLSEFNAQPETNPKTGVFSATSKPVKAGTTGTVILDYSKYINPTRLLPITTGAINVYAVGAEPGNDYDVLLSDFTIVWAENTHVKNARIAIDREKAKAGDTIGVAVRASEIKISDDITVEFRDSDDLFAWRVRLSDDEKSILKKNGIVGMKTQVPKLAATDSYTAVIVVDGYRVKDSIPSEIQISNSGKYDYPTCEVKEYKGATAIYLDGKPFDWNGIASAAYCPGMAYEFAEQQGSSVFLIETNAGCHNYAVNSYPTLVAPDKNDYSELTETCRYTVQASEEAYLILRINMCLPEFWADSHRDSIALGTTNGKSFVRSEESIGVTNISLSSTDWILESLKQLDNMFAYIKTQPWCSRVIGCMLTGGVTEEWFAFFHNTEGYWGDYSEVNCVAFRKWCIENGYYSEGDDIHVPLPSERTEKNYTVKNDTAENKLASVYTKFINETCVNDIITFAERIKKDTGGRILCGALYGYMIEFASSNSPTQSGSLYLSKYLSSEYIDYLSCIPLLDWRDPTNGYDIGASLTRSVQTAGKIYVQENDTWLSTYTKRSYPSSKPNDKTDGNEDMVTSTFGYDMVYGNARHYFGLFASWHHVQWADKVFADFNAIQEANISADRTPKDDIAFMVDDASYVYSEETSTYLTLAVKEQLKTLGRTGCSVGTYLLSDIDKLPDSVKMIFVSVSWSPTSETLKKLNAVIAKGDRTVVLVGPVGLINYETGEYDYDSTSKITGFDITVKYSDSLKSVSVSEIDGKKVGTTASVDVNPYCFLSKTGAHSAIRKMSNGGQLIWLSVPMTNVKAMREIAILSGVNPTANIYSYVHTSEELVSVTSGKTETQNIFIGGKFHVVDILTGWESNGNNTFSCNFYAGQTRLFKITKK